MSKQRPRMMLTISYELHEALMELSEATGIAGASFASQVLEQSVPYLREMARAARRAKVAPAEALGIMHDALLEVQSKGEQAVLEIDQERRLRIARGAREYSEQAFKGGWWARDQGKPRKPPRSVREDDKPSWFDGWDAAERDHQQIQAMEGGVHEPEAAK